jgi:hypothetical protein
MKKGDLSNMKRRLAALACIMLLACVASVSAQGSDWKEYAYPDGGFAVSFPSEPTLHTSMVPLKNGGETEMRQYVVDKGDYALLAIVSHAPSGDGVSLTGARDGAVAAVKGRIVSERQISLGNYPGLQVDIEMDTTHARARARYYAVGSTLYQLISVATSGKPISLDTTRFFASFRLLGASTVSR